MASASAIAAVAPIVSTEIAGADSRARNRALGDVVTKVVWPIWPKINETNGTDGGSRTLVALVPDLPVDGEAAATPAAPGVTAARDPAALLTALSSERISANSGFGHPHSASGCGFCRRAAAVYR